MHYFRDRADGYYIVLSGFAASDWVEISPQEYEAQNPPPSRNAMVVATLAKARAMRLPVMQVLDGLQASAIVNNSTVLVSNDPVALALVIEQCKQALRALPQQVDLSAATTKQQMETIVLLAYKSIVDGAPAEIKTAFDSLKP